MEKNQEKHFTWHSFCLNPNLHFDGQDKDEHPILVLRAHPITQLPWLINAFFFIIFLLFLNLYLPQYLGFYQLFFVDLFGVALVFSYLYFNFLHWFFNVGIITNKRILDVDFYGLIYKETTIAMLNKVEDITAKVGGVFSSLFDYGNVFIQTAGTDVNIEFINIPKPQQVAKIINQLLKNG